MSVLPDVDRWRATQAHLRALLLAGLGATASVLLQRPDVLVLSVPFVIIAVWSTLARPRRTPRHSQVLSQRSLREGDTVTWGARVEPVEGIEEAATVLRAAPYSRLEPEGGQRSVFVPADQIGPGMLHIGTGVRSLRWGAREIGPGMVAATSAWGAYRWGPVEFPPLRLTTVPLPSAFDTRAPAPHPRGLVGLHRSARPGDGSEFATIRPFQVGDRLRRIHWARSLRAGELHVTSSYADEDSHVALIVDAYHELGTSEGIDGASSTLDLSVRAAGAVAEHFLHGGDRVSLRVVGDARATRVPAASGRRHLLRVLDSLAAIEPGTDAAPDELTVSRLQLGLGAGTLVVMMSPLVSPEALAQAALLAHRGLTVVVIDAMVSDAAPRPDGLAEYAWRIRMLERDQEIRTVQRSGVPVVPWRGPGSLDQVLRQLGQHGARTVRR